MFSMAISRDRKHPISRRLSFETLDPRRLLVVVTDDPGLHEADDDEFSGVGEIVLDPQFDVQSRCTGTLLGDGRHALTAAHCLASMNDGATWHIGFDPIDVGGVVQPITYFPFTRSSNPALNDVFIHPNFAGNFLEYQGYDLAIIDLCLPQCPTHLENVGRYDILRDGDVQGDGPVNVDGSDFGVWNAHRFTFVTDGFTKGDGNADDIVDGTDFGIWNANKFTNWRCFGGCQQMAMGGGATSNPMAPSSSWMQQYNRLLERHHIYINGNINGSLTSDDWARFADALMSLLDRL